MRLEKASIKIGAALAALSILAVSAPAQAYSFEWNEAKTGTPRSDRLGTCVTDQLSYVCYQPYGDVIWVYDMTSSDHASAVARWYTDYGRWGTCRNKHGAGTWAYCNKEFAENRMIYFRAAQYDGNTGQYVRGESVLQHWST